VDVQRQAERVVPELRNIAVMIGLNAAKWRRNEAEAA
jgi:hypothetical protein